ncbi:homocysteine S-methyltransferase family protein [Rhodovibrionaceae bacterium A322]
MSYQAIDAQLKAGKVLLLDGATGTELQNRGVSMDPAAWCGPATLENKALLVDIHSDYIQAGSDVITANTFASSRLMLTPAGYGDQVAEINRTAVEAALEARDKADHPVAVAGSLSHMVPVEAGTANVDPATIPSDAQVSDALHELAGILKDSGVDHIMLEMMYHPGRAKLALEAAQSTGLPVWFGLSARRGDKGETLSFHHLDDLPLSAVTALLPGQNLAAAGVMHTPSHVIADSLAEIRKAYDGPLMAYPDSGYFEMPAWRFIDVIPPEELQDLFQQWIRESGVQLIGGCCGLTVAHIDAAARARAAVAA